MKYNQYISFNLAYLQKLFQFCSFIQGKKQTQINLNIIKPTEETAVNES